MISSVSVYSGTGSCNGSIPVKEHRSVLTMNQNVDGFDIMESMVLNRSGKFIQNYIFGYSNPHANFQYPEQDLLNEQNLIILEHQKRTKLRVLSYLKN